MHSRWFEPWGDSLNIDQSTACSYTMSIQFTWDELSESLIYGITVLIFWIQSMSSKALHIPTKMIGYHTVSRDS